MPAVSPICWNRWPLSCGAGESMVRRARAAAARVTDAAIAEFRALARGAAEDAIKELLRLSLGSDSESLRLAATKELLDRGFDRVAAAPSEGAGGVIGHVMVDDGYGNEGLDRP